MRIGVLQFPGSNCERETALAIKRVGMEPVDFLWNEDPEKLRALDGYVLVGGFSYEDRSRAGIIAALDPVMQVVREAAALGKPVLGICNGAQILVETGLVPGLENNKVALSLTENKRVKDGKVLGTGYYNQWVNITLSEHYQRNAFTKYVTPKDILRLPVAHGEGRFVMSEVLYNEMKGLGLNVWLYCDEKGEVIDQFPVNPNGSLGNIAAISNKAGNVLAIMPHPERTEGCDVIFASMRDYIKQGHFLEVAPLNYYPRMKKVTHYTPPEHTQVCIVELSITDNEALTVQNTLRQLGVSVDVKRQVHWEIACDEAELERVLASEVLFNPRKEIKITKTSELKPTLSYLVRAKEDLRGMQTLQTLQDHFAITGVKSLKVGVVWHFTSRDEMTNDLKEVISQTNIIKNEYAHDYYEYN